MDSCWDIMYWHTQIKGLSPSPAEDCDYFHGYKIFCYLGTVSCWQVMDVQSKCADTEKPQRLFYASVLNRLHSIILECSWVLLSMFHVELIPFPCKVSKDSNSGRQ